MNYSTKSRDEVSRLHRALDAALAQAFAGTNVRMAGSGLTYSATGEVTVKLKLCVDHVGDAGQVETAEAARYRVTHKFDGLPADGVGKRFTYADGKVYEITGAVNHRSDKCYCVKRVSDGKPLVATARMLRMGLGLPEVNRFGVPLADHGVDVGI